MTYVRVALHADVLVLTRTLTERHPLRGFDAIHLASALHLAHILEEAMPFAAADTRLLRAAATEGLPPINVEAAPAT